jgi:hypothetical protein
MPGELNLITLLRTLRPELHPQPYAFCSLAPEAYVRLETAALGMFREREGVTVILEHAAAERLGLPAGPAWACITLTVHSALEAIGMLAAVSARLAEAGVSCNPVAGYYHDHLFVPWDARQRAVEALEALSSDAGILEGHE